MVLFGFRLAAPKMNSYKQKLALLLLLLETRRLRGKARHHRYVESSVSKYSELSRSGPLGGFPRLPKVVDGCRRASASELYISDEF